ncbi:hypothetical protein ACTJKN_25395 [Pedobacter sp. 22163]|uniref:hypothetical protein n=1 Tax=Pedobacter sp. 22163 TaxID=3453883 RepID=UPI003F837A64
MPVKKHLLIFRKPAFSVSLVIAAPLFIPSPRCGLFIQSGLCTTGNSFWQGMIPTGSRTFVPKPDGSEHPDSSIGIKRTAGRI